MTTATFYRGQFLATSAACSLLAMVALLAVALPAAAVNDIFLELDGIEGESKHDLHKDAIDVLSWSWGVTNSGSLHTGGGGSVGKASVTDLKIVKFNDKSSALLLMHALNSKTIAQGTLTVRRGGEAQQEFIRIELEEVLVTSISQANSSGEDRGTEALCLNFARFRFTYIEYGPDGKKVGEHETGFDIPKNTGL